MKKRTLIMVLGLLIAIVPILGLPSSWKNVIIIVAGLAVALFATTRRGISGLSMNTDSISSEHVSTSTIKRIRKPRMSKAKSEESMSEVDVSIQKKSEVDSEELIAGSTEMTDELNEESNA